MYIYVYIYVYICMYVSMYICTRVLSCNARNKMKLQERTTSKKQLGGTFESIVLRDPS